MSEPNSREHELTLTIVTAADPASKCWAVANALAAYREELLGPFENLAQSTKKPEMRSVMTGPFRRHVSKLEALIAKLRAP